MNITLCNSLRKISIDGCLTIGYFGGSITEGTGASNTETRSWRALVTFWFKENYPHCSINEIQAAIGGTGSDLGAYRCERDLLSGNPDLVFIEFAVNDNKKNEDEILRSMEGIIRQIWRWNTTTDIVFVYTITKEMANAYDNGNEPYTVVLHQKIADYYGIPSVNAGKKLWKYFESGSFTWEELLPDTVHPSDIGYEIYGDEIKRSLSMLLTDGETNRQMKIPLSQNSCENGRLIDAWELYRQPWEKDDRSLAGRYPHMLVCNIAGAELEYYFTGRAIGVYWLVAEDSGDIEWSIDGDETKKLSSWDKHALSFTRASYSILDDNLEKKEHVLKLRVSNEKQPESKGNWIRIGAILLE